MARDRAPLPPPIPVTPADVSPISGVPGQGTYFLGRYRVIDEIGVGGMASVFLARVDGLGGFQRWFAIKRIHSHLVDDESFVNMFLDEANVAAKISHPNVATVFELGRAEDTYWIAMEYLHGEPLREVMRRCEELGSTMPPEIACRVFAEAADGLHAAHELTGKDGEKLGLIHRDVTPHNLFVTYEGVTKVVDFGIAKFQDRIASTQAGMLKGKLAYMSPEQVAGEPIDRRTDIFALGVVLWELTTGQRLFRMESDLDTLARVQECNIPPPSTIVRGYPLDLERILMQALAKNRNERFQTAREFSRALQSLLSRRGLFIASDEVAAYMSSIFADRIAKREEHLRWAAAVNEAAVASSGSVQPPPPQPAPPSRATAALPVNRSPLAPPRAPPRPAVGAPAKPATSGANGPESRTMNEIPTLQRPPTATVALPPAKPAPKSKPIFELLPTNPGVAEIEDIPPESEDLDRTVQATVAQQAAAHAGFDSSADDDFDNDATIVSKTGPDEMLMAQYAREVMGDRAVPPVVPAAGVPAQAASRPQTAAMPAFGRTVPMAPTPAVPFQAHSGPTAPHLRTQLGLAPAFPSMRGAPPPPFPGAAPPPFPGAVAQPRHLQPAPISDPALPAEMLGNPPAPVAHAPVPGGWGGAAIPSPYGAVHPPPEPIGRLPDFGDDERPQYPPMPAAYPGPAYPGPAYPGPAYPAPPGPAFPAPARTTSVALRTIRPKPVPVWVVAIASCVIALFLAGGGVFVYSFVRGSGPPQASPSPSSGPNAVASAGTNAATSGQPAPSASAGIFAAARAAFVVASTPPPAPSDTAADTPPPAPSAAPAPSDTAAAAASAASTAAPPVPAAPPPAPPPPAPAAAPTPQPQPTPVPQPAPTPRNPSPSSGSTAAAGGAGAAHGFLSVICLPGCDRIELDGQPLGPSPVFRYSTVVGSHRIKLVTVNPPATKVVSKVIVADAVAVVRESMP